MQIVYKYINYQMIYSKIETVILYLPIDFSNAYQYPVVKHINKKQTD